MQKEPSSLHFPDARFRLNSGRAFLVDVGRGMLASSVSSTQTFDLGLLQVFADEGPVRLSFGKLEPLVALMQDTPPDKFQRQLVGEIKTGIDLRTLIAAGVLANDRAFGGQDYVGFLTIMALAPAFEMSRLTHLGISRSHHVEAVSARRAHQAGSLQGSEVAVEKCRWRDSRKGSVSRQRNHPSLRRTGPRRQASDRTVASLGHQQVRQHRRGSQ